MSISGSDNHISAFDIQNSEFIYIVGVNHILYTLETNGMFLQACGRTSDYKSL
jgi:hypothetical protein